MQTQFKLFLLSSVQPADSTYTGEAKNIKVYIFQNIEQQKGSIYYYFYGVYLPYIQCIFMKKKRDTICLPSMKPLKIF